MRTAILIVVMVAYLISQTTGRVRPNMGPAQEMKRNMNDLIQLLGKGEQEKYGYCDVDTNATPQFAFLHDHCSTETVKETEEEKLAGGKPVIDQSTKAWFVEISRDHKLICGGTMISNKLVLTAAHCFNHILTEGRRGQEEKACFTVDNFHAVRMSQKISGGAAERRKIKKIYVPADYKISDDGSRQNDVALAVVDRDFMSEFLTPPLCLLASGPKSHHHCTALGIGYTDESALTTPNDLMHINTAVYNCTAVFRHVAKHVPGVKCFNSVALKGDSGGVVICKPRRSSGQYYMAGVMSRRLRGWTVITDMTKTGCQCWLKKVRGMVDLSSSECEEKFAHDYVGCGW